MTVKHRGQQQARKTTARPSSPTTIKPKGAVRVRTPKSAMRDHVAPREEVERYERKIAERSPSISPGARKFLAQMRANPDYRAVMRDLADK
jgi:hypothetical protein